LCWFFREPKQFTGGGLTFTEPNYKINLKHNRMVMFPSYMMHEVEPVKFDKQPKDMGYGRYTITHFFYNVF
jgi:Rps23 Pro-64 3,4-dihydroxylase Tpa1-like proline 4-hydroxylase